MKFVGIVQMLAQLGTLLVVCVIASQLSQLIKMLGRQFVWGGLSSSSRVMHAPSSSRVASAEPTGFAVWAWQDSQWALEHNRSQAGYLPSSPPQSTGAFAGERVRTSSVRKS